MAIASALNEPRPARSGAVSQWISPIKLASPSASAAAGGNSGTVGALGGGAGAGPHAATAIMTTSARTSDYDGTTSIIVQPAKPARCYDSGVRLLAVLALAGCGPRMVRGGEWTAAAPVAEPGATPSKPASEEATPIPALRITQLDEQATGFDLHVRPAGIVAWRLDEETRTDPLPARVRGLSPGMHTIEIDAPPGYLGRIDSFRLARDQALKIEVVLMPTASSAVVPVEPVQ